MIEIVPPSALFLYISPTNWVPKDMAETKFRLVTNFRWLNEVVKPEVSMFLTPAKVMTQIDPACQVFMVSDLASSYHQLKIPRNNQHLFRFFLEDGVYIYTRQPIGIINSSHCFINVVNRFLAYLEITMEATQLGRLWRDFGSY